MFRALIADDHPLFRSALRQAIESLFGEYEIFEASTLDEAREVIASNADLDLDMILLDLQMPGSAGFSGLVTLRNAAPEVPIVCLRERRRMPAGRHRRHRLQRRPQQRTYIVPAGFGESHRLRGDLGETARQEPGIGRHLLRRAAERAGRRANRRREILLAPLRQVRRGDCRQHISEGSRRRWRSS
jgi:CheY-like chemotaxis protein